MILIHEAMENENCVHILNTWISGTWTGGIWLQQNSHPIHSQGSSWPTDISWKQKWNLHDYLPIFKIHASLSQEWYALLLVCTISIAYLYFCSITNRNYTGKKNVFYYILNVTLTIWLLLFMINLYL